MLEKADQQIVYSENSLKLDKYLYQCCRKHLWFSRINCPVLKYLRTLFFIKFYKALYVNYNSNKTFINVYSKVEVIQIIITNFRIDDITIKVVVTLWKSHFNVFSGQIH